MQPTLSVVVPTHNRGSLLERCVRSLISGTPPDAEIIVSDDGSTDDTQERVSTLHTEEPRIRWLPGPRTGPAGARNRGWRAAHGSIVAFIDDDCVAEVGWGHRLVRALEVDPALAGAEGHTKPEWPARGFYYHSIDSAQGSYLTCNIAFRREALERVGGLDERFPYPASEDLDLAYRIMASGRAVGYVPEAVVRHAVVRIGPRHYLRRVRYDPSVYRLFARHPMLFLQSNRLVRVPLFREVTIRRPPGFLQVFLYLVSYRMHHAYFCLRDGGSLSEKAVGFATHVLCALASLRYIVTSFAAYRDGLHVPGPQPACNRG